MSIVNALLFVGLDLTCRDRLHDAWGNNHLVAKMGLLILVGGILSYVTTSSAGRIAVASTVAFAVAASADALVYHLARRLPWLARTNASNAAGAFADSLIFPTLAFGSFMPGVVILQFAAKIGGGAFWSLVLRKTA